MLLNSARLNRSPLWSITSVPEIVVVNLDHLLKVRCSERLFIGVPIASSSVVGVA